MRNVPTLAFLPAPTCTGMDGPFGAPTVTSKLRPADGGYVTLTSFVVLKFSNKVALKLMVNGISVNGMLKLIWPWS